MTGEEQSPARSRNILKTLEYLVNLELEQFALQYLDQGLSKHESEKVDCDFLGPSWWNKKVNPEI